MSGPVYYDRVRETTATTGTGTYTLTGAVTGFIAFSTWGDGNTGYYGVTDGTDWEVGLGTYTLAGTTLARTTVLASSNGNAAVSWGAGSKSIWGDLPALFSSGLVNSGTAFSPAVSDGHALGTTALQWSDEFLASGAVINFSNGDVTITHSTNALAFAGASNGYSFDANVSVVTINKVTLTAPATGSTLTIADGKTLTASNTLTLAGTDGKTLTVSNSLTLAGTDSTIQTFPPVSSTLLSLGYSNNPFINLSLVASVGSSALTVAIKGQDGNDPSATNPVYISFRSATLTSGANAQLAITAATSIVISSGSTMGFTSAVIGKLWLVGFNDGGTFRLGLVNCLSGTSIMALADGIYSSTAEGGAGGADSAQVIYTGTAVSSKAMTVLGYLEATEATAGTWATAPSKLQVRTPSTLLPGSIIQRVPFTTGAVATGTTIIPADDTIPQSTEGDQFMSNSITPTSGANVVFVDAETYISSSVAQGLITVAMFQDSGANAVAVMGDSVDASGRTVSTPLQYNFQPGSTSSTTLKIRAGCDGAATQTFNGQGGGRKFGGTLVSRLLLEEYVA